MFTLTQQLCASRPALLFMAMLTLASCSRNEDDNVTPGPGGGGSSGTPTLGFSYIYFDVQGPAVSVNDSITLSSTGDPNMSIFGGLVEEQTPAGIEEVVSLVCNRLLSGGETQEVQMYIPAEAASNPLSSFETTSTGLIIGSGTFNMKVRISNAFYDNDGDGDNDVLTPLLSTESTVVTVTDFDTTGTGILAVDFIKGSISGTMELLVFVDPFTEPAPLTHTITGTFEYHRP